MSKRHFISCSVFFCLLACATDLFALDDSAIKTKWGYEKNDGPAKWAQLSPHFAACGVGKLQSPLNVSPEIINRTSKLELRYQPTTLNIVKDGDTSLMIGREKTIINDGHAIQLNFPPERTSEIITFAGNEYRLIQFHFHTPGENTLFNKSYPAEIHFVHQGENGTLAVIGVFIKEGQKNPVLQKILDRIPTDKNKPLEFKGERISPLDLFPANKNHYDFKGSLTTPPCAEGIEWIVMQNPITASSEQIAALKAATNGNNERPVQQRNKRDIYFSQE